MNKTFKIKFNKDYFNNNNIFHLTIQEKITNILIIIRNFLGCNIIWNIKVLNTPTAINDSYQYNVKRISKTYRLFYIKLFTIKDKYE